MPLRFARFDRSRDFFHTASRAKFFSSKLLGLTIDQILRIHNFFTLNIKKIYMYIKERNVYFLIE